MARRTLRSTLLYAAMLIAVVVVLAPFAWLLISSVAAPVDLLRRPLQWIPTHIGYDRFAQLTFGSSPDDTAQGFRSAIVNSMVIASTVTVVSLIAGTLAAYAFARLRFPGRGWLVLAFMATYMLPPIALILPLYQIMNLLHLRDTPLALIIVYSSFVTPFVIWIMTHGGPANSTQSIAIYAYQTAYQGFDFGRGAALGYLIALVIMVLAAVYLRLLGRVGQT